MQDEDAGRPYRKFMWVSQSCLTIIMDEENGVVHKNLQALPSPCNFLSCVWSVACGFKDTFPFSLKPINLLRILNIFFNSALTWLQCFHVKISCICSCHKSRFPILSISSGSKVCVCVCVWLRDLFVPVSPLQLRLILAKAHHFCSI